MTDAGDYVPDYVKFKNAPVSVGSPEVGLWCDRCMTAAGIEVSIYWLVDDGPHEFAKRRACLRCDYGEGVQS